MAENDPDEQLDEQKRGTPPDFGGPVFPNPRGLQVSPDTASGIPPTRLPKGVSFQHENFSGEMPKDTSNPPAAQLIAHPASTSSPVSVRGVNTSQPTAATAATEEQPPAIHSEAAPLNLPAEKPTIPSLAPIGQKQQADEQRQQQLAKGSGIAQIGNPWARGALRGLNIVGGILAPRIMGYIPGTEEHHEALVKQNQQALTADQATQEKEAETAEKQAQTANLNSEIGARATPEEKLQAALTEKGYTLTKDANGMPALQRVPGFVDPLEEKLNQSLLTKGYTLTKDEQGNPILTDVPGFNRTEKPAHIAYDSGIPVSVTDSEGKTYDVNDPKLPPELKPLVAAATKAHSQHIKEQADVQARMFANQQNRTDTAANRKDIAAHDKAYVQPAEAVEKSYQMMDNAFREYEDARAQGKQLPTGAQSMLALSTHLQTTFGNVKGARVTKDMIHEHLGARSISDDARAAIQKLQDGDVLSPAQWKAFHDLIGESRKLSWQTAVKEAERKKIPVDFLPPDLKEEDLKAKTENAAPPEYKAGMVRNGYKFKGGDPTDKKNWEKQ